MDSENDLEVSISKAYKKFFSRTKSTDFKRIHISNQELLIENFEDITQKDSSKPTGLWYGHNTSWIDWCSCEMPHWLQPFIYEIIIDDDQIYKIKNVKEFEAFEKNYKSALLGLESEYCGDILSSHHIDYCGDILSSHHIDYEKLSQEYGGIEIIPYLWEKRLHMKSFWYYGWDVASGCVFNKNAVKEIRFLAKYDPIKSKFIKI